MGQVEGNSRSFSWELHSCPACKWKITLHSSYKEEEHAVWAKLFLVPSWPALGAISAGHGATFLVSAYSAVKWGYPLCLAGFAVRSFKEFCLVSADLVWPTRNTCSSEKGELASPQF